MYEACYRITRFVTFQYFTVSAFTHLHNRLSDTAMSGLDTVTICTNDALPCLDNRNYLAILNILLPLIPRNRFPKVYLLALFLIDNIPPAF